MKRKVISLVLPIALFFAFCGKKIDRHGVDLQVTMTPSAVTDSLYLKMDYAFQTQGDFKKFTTDYNVFVHFWRVNSKEMLIQDDHEPLKKTTAWEKNDKLEYSRVLFIPQFLNEFDVDFEGYEEIQVTVGLYNLKALGKEKPIVLFEKKINVQPASFNAPEIVYDEGWNGLEIDVNASDAFHRSWRWTMGKAVCIIENPKKDCTLIIKGGVSKNVFPDQKVIFRINDTLLEEFIPAEALFSREYTLTPEQMGDGDEFFLRIETDKVFVPARAIPGSTDNRELGMQIFFVYFREKIQ
jgi:hypothetical protein